MGRANAREANQLRSRGTKRGAGALAGAREDGETHVLHAVLLGHRPLEDAGRGEREGDTM